MTSLEAAHLEIAKEVFIHQVKEFDMAAVSRMAGENPKRVENALGAVASFAYQAAEAFVYCYKVDSNYD